MRAHYLKNQVSLVHSGKEFFTALLEIIKKSKETIHLQTYIFENDQTGQLVADALVEAAQRKVNVFLLADGFASQHLSKDLIKQLKEAGVHFRFFAPFFSSRNFYFGRRLHHKVVVADQCYALVGGINIADRYSGMDGDKAWYDLALYIEGESCRELHAICVRIWRNKKSWRRTAVLPGNVKCAGGPHAVAIRVNDWIKHKQEITATYSGFFRECTTSLTIMCSYFLPGLKFRKQLQRAVKRGVKIKVILTAVSDVGLSKYAERHLYRWMLRNHISIYEYQPTVLHAKLAMMDEKHLTIGSYNINNLSKLASIELNAEVMSGKFVKEVWQETEAIIEKDCIAIDSESKNLKLFSINQFFQWSAFQLVRLIISLGTFYFKKE